MDPEPPKRRATYEDLETVPENYVGEIVDGELYVTRWPGFVYACAQSKLMGLLGSRFRVEERGPERWVMFFKPELHLGGDALVPDLVGWRRTRMPVIPNVAAFTLAPDWVCEVLAPSTVVLDREKKMPAYAREGVGHLWLVDPFQQTLEVYRLEEGCWKPQGQWSGQSLVRAEPFEVFEFNLDELWEW